MKDPAQDMEDHEQDARLAMCTGRLMQNGFRTAVRNGLRTNHRRAKCHARHQNYLREQPYQFEEQSPVDIVTNRDLATRAVKILHEHDRALLATLLLRQLGFSRSQVADMTRQSEETVSRAPKRAARICSKHGLEG